MSNGYATVNFVWCPRISLVGMKMMASRQRFAIFISYRTSDTDNEAQKLSSVLRERFGTSAVFIDKRELHGGMKHFEEIGRALSSSSVVIALIGPSWSTIDHNDDLPDPFAPDDWVKSELSYAIRNDIEIIPVLVRRQDMPKRKEMPNGLDELLRYQFMKLSSPDYFDLEADKIAKRVSRIIEEAPRSLLTKIKLAAIRRRLNLRWFVVGFVVGSVIVASGWAGLWIVNWLRCGHG